MDPCELWLSRRLSPPLSAVYNVRGSSAVVGCRRAACAISSGSATARRRQRVLYIGVDGQWAAQLTAWLARQQAPRRRLAELRRLAAEVGVALHGARRQAAPCAKLGKYFHGAELRRRRASITPQESNDQPATPAGKSPQAVTTNAPGELSWTTNYPSRPPPQPI